MKMKAELFLISPHEEYAVKHMCRRHWNFQWRGRRGSNGIYGKPKIRKESFGGLLMGTDGKLWKVDNEAYFWLNLILN